MSYSTILVLIFAFFEFTFVAVGVVYKIWKLEKLRQMKKYFLILPGVGMYYTLIWSMYYVNPFVWLVEMLILCTTLSVDLRTKTQERY